MVIFHSYVSLITRGCERLTPVAGTQVLHVEPEDLKVLNAVAEDVDDAEKPVTWPRLGRVKVDR